LNDSFRGLIEKVHAVFAAWLMVNDCPAMVTAPDLAGPELVPTVRFTVPLPVPEAPETTVIQLTALDAVHGHVAPAVTVAELEPPAAGMAAAGAVTE
jgi:hypothetical protein